MFGVARLALLFAVAVVGGSAAVAGGPPTRDDVVASIKEIAGSDAKAKVPQAAAVVEAFKADAAAVGLSTAEVLKVYNTTYAEEAKRLAPGAFADFAPHLGWVAAVVLFVALVFKDALRDWLKGRTKAVGEWAYQRLAGRRWWWRFALARYRAALVGKYAALTVPFRPDRSFPMEDVYVPLQCHAAGEGDRPGVNVRDALAANARLVVTGAPGSGKSLLLKELALAFGQGFLGRVPGRAVPVLVELHRFGGSKQTLEQFIVAEFARNDFPRADAFVTGLAQTGKLLVLLDGLDEIVTTDRADAVTRVKDFLGLHPHCRAVVTCRTAVYRGDLAGTADRVFEVRELTDQQVRRMLRSWRAEMPDGKSVEQLVQTLRDRPPIMAVARNPLMLTMIAALSTNAGFVLPHSRAEFYRLATDFLLGHLHPGQNRYEARTKRSVLEGLALLNADRVDPAQDVRSIPYKLVLDHVRAAAPTLNVKPEDTPALLKEIVERSGLLLEIDGGQRYQFAHLTIQEYFAAQALIDNGPDLVARFDADPDRWRETLKLWCGLAPDSTAVVRAVSERRRSVTGLECLADALKVDQALADDLVEWSKPRLAPDDTRLLRAFGAVAADARPRGRAVYDFLAAALVGPHDGGRRAAAMALAMTNLPRAAALLASHYHQDEHFRTALVQMGDLAVAALVARVAAGDPTPLDDLRAIGTREAAEGVLPLLWHAQPDVARRAAWCLASLLPQPDVEAALRDARLTPAQKAAPKIDYVWQPFDEPAESALPVIAGRVARLLTDDPGPYDPTAVGPIDCRLAIPLCGVEMADALHRSDLKRRLRDKQVNVDLLTALGLPVENPHLLPGLLLRSKDATVLDVYEDTRVQYADRPVECDTGWNRFLGGALEAVGVSRVPRMLLGATPTGLRVRLLRNILKGPTPKAKDWVNVHRPSDFNMIKSPLLVILIVIATAILLIPFARAATTYWSDGASPWAWAYLTPMIVAGVAIAVWGLLIWGCLFDNPAERQSPLRPATLIIPLALVIIVYMLYRPSRRYISRGRWTRGFFNADNNIVEDAGYIFSLLMTFVLITLVPAGTYFLTDLLFSTTPWPLAALGLAAVVGVVMALHLVLEARDRAARNPLYGLLVGPAQTAAGARP